MNLDELAAHVAKEEQEAAEYGTDEDTDVLDDLSESLELLTECEEFLLKLLRKRNRRLTAADEKTLKELLPEVSAHLSQWQGPEVDTLESEMAKIKEGW